MELEILAANTMTSAGIVVMGVAFMGVVVWQMWKNKGMEE